MTDEATLKAGDVVRLRSGGLKMVVGWVKGALCLCCWFNQDGEYKAVDIPKNALEIVQDGGNVVLNIPDNGRRKETPSDD